MNNHAYDRKYTSCHQEILPFVVYLYPLRRWMAYRLLRRAGLVLFALFDLIPFAEHQGSEPVRCKPVGNPPPTAR